MTDIVWVYTTVANREEAEAIGRTLVEERLAACVNIVGEIDSIFWWEGAVQSEKEVAMTAKTQSQCLEPLLERVKALHSYECPCIVALPILQGHPPFLDWVREQTQAKPS